jgi:hypothetical protein
MSGALLAGASVAMPGAGAVLETAAVVEPTTDSAAGLKLALTALGAAGLAAVMVSPLCGAASEAAFVPLAALAAGPLVLLA